MIQPASLAALRAYTTLKVSIQGVLARRSHGYTLVGDVVEDPSLKMLGVGILQKMINLKNPCV